ncbi:MAG: C1 family peptidase [Ruminococcus sp.]|nr:C1 family peptidase [Ruminococcus sp.]
MNSKILKICSTVLSATMLLSMFPSLPINAAETNSETTKSGASFKTVKDKNGIHFYGPTGNNLTDKSELPDDVTTINSVSEYNQIAGNADKLKRSKLIKKSSVLPDSVDNSKSIYFPEIGDQGNLGSCLFWANVYYQYTYEMNKAMNIPTTSENTFSPQWSYNVVTAGEDMQCQTPFVLNFMKYQGSVPMSQVPYDSEYLNAHPTEEIWRNSINYRIKDFHFFKEIGASITQITSPDDSDLELIKTALNNGEILSYSTMMYGWTHTELTANSEAPENDKYVGQSAVTSMDTQEGGHRMTLVGYNDNIWIDINKNSKVDKGEMGAFKIANSWGTEYGNDGYCWVAYDAINDVSCVKGVPSNKERSSIFTEITRLEIQPYGTNTDVYLKYTLNTADRTQAIVSVTAEKDGTIYKKSTESNMNYGPAVAFDGSNFATDATLIFPLQGAFPELTSENFTDYTWTIEVKDFKDDGTDLTVKDIKIVDEPAGKIYEVSDHYPLVLDGKSENILHHKSNLNHAVVYYRGYYTPSISYKIDKSDVEWKTDIAITESFEKYGYTHKFVIDLETSDKATLYFSDENGDVDNNNGKCFTATKGINCYITENVGKPLELKMTNDLNEVADVGRFGLFETEASGGYEPYLFEYTFTNLTTGEVTVEDYYDSPEKGFYFTQAGDYEVVVKLKDCAGSIISDVNYVTITSIPFEFTTFEVTAQNDTLVNSYPITFTAVTNFENIGIYYQVYNEYNLTIKRDDNVCYSTIIPMKYDMTNSEYMTSTIIAEWIPTESGTYSATISATDCAGEYAEKTITFTVNDCIIGDADGNGEINVLDVTFLQMYLADLIEYDSLRNLIADANKDNNIDINDVTYIQMYVADFPELDFVGDILYPNVN